MMRTQQFVAALVLVGALVLALGSTGALAGSNGKGATVINVDECFPLDGGMEACFTAKGVIHEVTTPSGNVSYTGNVRESLVITQDGQSVWEETSDERVHSLKKDDVLHEVSSRSTYTVTVLGQTFCVQYHLHGTNGVDQFVRSDFCSE